MVLVTLALSAVLAWQAPRVRIDNDVENLLPPDDPEVAYYQAFRDTFGTEELVLVALDGPGSAFEPARFAALAALTEALSALRGVEQVISVANLQTLVPDPAGPPRFAPLVPPDARTDPEALGHAGERLRAWGLATGYLISEDLRTTSILVRLSPPTREERDGYPAEVVGRIRSEAARLALAAGTTVHVGGTPTVKADLVGAIRKDTVRFIPIVLAVVAASLLAIFRRPGAVLLPLAIVGLAAAVVVGLIHLTGRGVNTVTSLIAPLLFAIGVSDVVHLLAHFRRRVGAGDPRAEAARDATSALLVPCLLTSITTAFGFLSLLVSDVRPVREFGAFSAAGAGVCFLLALGLVPALLALVPAVCRAGPVPEAGSTPGARAPGPVARSLARLAVVHPWWVLGTSGVVFLAGLAGMSRLEVETNFLRYFPHDGPVRRASEFITERLSGAAPIEFVVTAGPGTSVLGPAQLEAVEGFQRWLVDEHPEIDRAISVVDFLREARRLESGQPGLPTPEDVVRYRFLAHLYGMDEGLERVLDETRQRLRISARMRPISSRQLREFLGRLRAHLEAQPLPGLSVRPTGSSVIFNRVADHVVEGQIRSFSLAFVLIFGVMALLFRSVRMGLHSIYPNLLPIVVAFGVMGWLGVHLNITTAMVASISLGIAVDDTIHILSRLRVVRASTPGRAGIEEDLAETLASTGAACVTTSVILVGAFATLLVASFLPTREFGLIASVAIAVALAGDVLVLPAALAVFPPRARE
ncbi:MAG: RND family transporter [Planctomycetes bacterium]|nr:RND family transporter [Planctomycetota bacterium]